MLPFWYQPEAPLGSAVRYIAALSPKFQKVQIKPGPRFGTCPRAESQLVVLIRNQQGDILGKIRVENEDPAAFGPEEEAAVRRVADELATIAALGEIWPE